MSYIGKNPKVDSVKLDGSATAASGTEEGQLYYNTGTGSISKGLKVFKNSQFVAIDKQLGDADTMQLLKAADIPAVDFSLSLTSTTVGGNNAVPFESSTGDFDGTASFSNSSTGNALLSDESADLVFHYQTQATNNADNDFFGIPLTVPKAFRGGNLVLEFKYRTLIATGTMDDGYFNIAIQDRSSAILQTQASTISAGAIAAGSNVLLTGKTYSNPVTSTTLTVAVGDRVFVESGTGTAGSQTNDIVDCYITSVSSTDNNVTLSKDIVAVQSGKFVTGWLTGYDTGGQISAFASDTNKDGTSKKIQFKTDADTQQVSLWFFVKGTSTVKHELFFDNILLSANKFLQASSQTKTESYRFGGDDFFVDSTGTATSGATDQFDKSLLVPGSDTPLLADSKLISITDVSNDTRIIAKQNIKLSFSIMGLMNTGQLLKIHDFNDLMLISSQNPDGSTGAAYQNATVNVTLKKDEYVYMRSDTRGNSFGACTITATSQTSPVVILESQDEIFTDWNAFTPTGTWSTNVSYEGFWRRVGSNMEIMAEVTCTGAPNSSTLAFNLPSGYVIDDSKILFKSNTNGENQFVMGQAWIQDGGGGNVDYAGSVGYENSTSLSVTVFYQDSMFIKNDPVSQASPITFASTDSVVIRATVPIKGFNANFNPLLSMPLQDFSSLENTFSARISSTGAITSQSGNCIASATKDSTGVYSVVFTSGFFGVAPSVVGIVEDNNRVFGITTGPTTSGFTYKLNVSGSLTDAGVDLIISRQGSDFRQAPQATAAVIKPAVAILYDQKASTSAGGAASTVGFHTRTLNTVKGESWFVTLNSTNNGFTLDPGMYDIEFSSPAYKVNSNQARLFDTTNSVVVQNGTNQIASSTNDGGSASSGKATVTIGSATEYKIELYVAASSTSGGALGVDVAGATYSIYTTVKISKLK